MHEIYIDGRIFLAHHILMRLKDDTRMRLVARGSGNAHDDIHGVVHFTFNVMLGSKRLQPAADLLLVLGRTRYLIDLSEDVKYFFGLDGIHIGGD